MPILVKELRISLVWNKAFAKDRLLPSLADSYRYRQEFNKAKSGEGEWLLPWQPGERQHFWQYYLCTSEIGDLEQVDAERAWEFLMPLRAPTWAKIDAPEGVRITLESFCFPHSVGVITTAFISPTEPMPLFAMVDCAINVRHSDYNIIWRDNGTATHGSLDSLADGLIDKLHKKVLKGTPHGKPLSSPLTISTVVEASGIWTEESKMGTEVNRALYGLCLLEPGWKEASSKGESNSRMPQHEVLERSRAIWDPRKFSEATSKNRRRALGCYHRNLALATLQTRSLTSLVRRAYEFLPHESIPIELNKPVKAAVKILMKLYNGSNSTYKSWSLLNQIHYNLEMIERVGQVIGEA